MGFSNYRMSKRHYIGSYKNKEEAIKARLEGEKKYFDPLIERLKKK